MLARIGRATVSPSSLNQVQGRLSLLLRQAQDKSRQGRRGQANIKLCPVCVGAPRRDGTREHPPSFRGARGSFRSEGDEESRGEVGQHWATALKRSRPDSRSLDFARDRSLGSRSAGSLGAAGDESGQAAGKSRIDLIPLTPPVSSTGQALLRQRRRGEFFRGGCAPSNTAPPQLPRRCSGQVAREWVFEIPLHPPLEKGVRTRSGVFNP